MPFSRGGAVLILDPHANLRTANRGAGERHALSLRIEAIGAVAARGDVRLGAAIAGLRALGNAEGRRGAARQVRARQRFGDQRRMEKLRHASHRRGRRRGGSQSNAEYAVALRMATPGGAKHRVPVDELLPANVPHQFDALEPDADLNFFKWQRDDLRKTIKQRGKDLLVALGLAKSSDKNLSNTLTPAEQLDTPKVGLASPSGVRSEMRQPRARVHAQ
jgi:hypothetical protein